MELSDEIYDELFAIWTERIKTKKYTREAYCFERAAGKYMLEEAEKLADLSWTPGGFNQFMIHHPDRVINAPIYQDRIAEAWITEKYIKPFVEPLVLPGNMACQEGKGSKQTMKLVKAILTDCFEKFGFGFWFVQYDMQGYYDNLAHSVIKKQYAGLPPDGFRLFCNILGSYESCIEVSYAKQKDPEGHYGVPKGNLPSQWCGVLYLNELDHILHNHPGCIGDVRYMDDGLVFFRTKAECVEVMNMIEQYLADNHMGIRLHPLKTCYAPISRGFNFCGWHYQIKLSGKILVHIKQDRKKLMKGELLWLQRQYAERKKSIVEVNDIFRGMMKYLEWGDTFHLRKYLANRYIFTHSPEDTEPMQAGYTEDELALLIDDILNDFVKEDYYEKEI